MKKRKRGLTHFQIGLPKTIKKMLKKSIKSGKQNKLKKKRKKS